MYVVVKRKRLVKCFYVKPNQTDSKIFCIVDIAHQTNHIESHCHPISYETPAIS